MYDRGRQIPRERSDLELPTLNTDIHTDLLHSHTVYQLLSVDTYQSSNKRPKTPYPTALGGIYPERFKRGPRNFKHLSGKATPINMPDMMSLDASGRLQNEIK